MNEEKKTAPALKLEKIKELKLATGVLSLDLSPDAATAFVSCMDGGVYSVAVASGARKQLGAHESYASGVALLPSAEVVSAGYDGLLQWFDPVGPDATKPLRRIAAHQFWSWQMAASSDARLLASVTGQYLCGGYKYEPLPEREPSVRVYEAATGKLLHSLGHVPPVLSVAFSRNGKFLAAGNLMGEVRIWELTSGKQITTFTTPSFTGWGIIKGHYYTGGIYALQFAEEDEELYLAGMGSTTDPAAGNGKQLWQRFAWREGRKLGETSDNDNGRGLMETLAFHPSGKYFAMGGRLENGKWSLAVFDTASGALLHALDTKSRVTKTIFTADGSQLLIAEALGQGKPKDGQIPDFGRITIFKIV